ncbi:LuxR family transcriptional regulator [Novosphingobium naphthalenivorans]|uniref:LuxR family transcriptional regulator n=1 Tax=Novosphingobium naphthalenivorans TaxID=273168 RepID=UPI000833FABE|nr:LuxR family transcriptional regulator [Novosphingobium naphthalenivorans]
MGVRKVFDRFALAVAGATCVADLAMILTDITRRMGYDYYALTHHIDWKNPPPGAIRIHNYPDAWVEFFDGHGLGGADPVHRASQRTNFGFTWHDVPKMIILTGNDRRILSLAAEHGLGNGYTVPANVPGEVHGSCSFAIGTDRDFPSHTLAIAQLAGALAFEGARRLSLVGARNRHPLIPVLTQRQRDCLIWAARGKTDWETSRILGISEETVAQHIREACRRYGVQKRTSLLIHALLDGTISFAEIIERRYPPFPG